MYSDMCYANGDIISTIISVVRIRQPDKGREREREGVRERERERESKRYHSRFGILIWKVRKIRILGKSVIYH